MPSKCLQTGKYWPEKLAVELFSKLWGLQNLVWVSRLHFIQKEITDRSLVYLEPNSQTIYCQLYLWKQWTWSVVPSVFWFNAVRLLVSILTGTSRLCRNGDFAQIIHMASNATYIQTFSYNYMVECCVNKQLKVTAKLSGESLLTLYY